MWYQDRIVYLDNIVMRGLTVDFGLPELWVADYRNPNGVFGHGHSIYDKDYVTRYKKPMCLNFKTRCTEYTMRMLWDWGERYHCLSEFGLLGKGWVCKNCGDYSPSGRAYCLKCGGTAEEKFVKPIQFPFYVLNISLPSIRCSDNEPTWIEVELKCPDYDKGINAIEILLEGTKSFCANGYSLNSGYYLCHYCGFAVPEGETCPGCGGKRFVFSEIVKLNRECVYCGKPTVGNIVCDGCGARVKGLTFRKAFQCN